MSLRCILISLLLLAGSFGHNRAFNVDEPVPIGLPDSHREVVRALNGFACRLYYEESLTAGDNFVFSPFGVTGSIVALSEVADRDAGEEIAGVLGLPDPWYGRIQLRYLYKYLQESIRFCDWRSAINSSNAIWLSEDFESCGKPGFGSSRSFRPGVGYVDFESEESFEKISRWEKLESENVALDKYRVPFPPHGNVLLTGLSVFDGEITFSFPDGVRKGMFHSQNGRSNNIEMIHDGWYLMERIVFDGAEMYVFPLGNDAMELCIFMPGEGRELSECRSLVQSGLIEMKRQVREEVEVDVTMPRSIELSCRKDFVSVLRRMGISKVFDDDDALSGLPAGCEVSSLMQSSTVRIKGIEGRERMRYLVREHDSGRKCGRVASIDRPFVFLIRERSTGLILFIGEVRNL